MDSRWQSKSSPTPISDTRLVLLTSFGKYLGADELRLGGIAECRSKLVRQSILFDCLASAMASVPNVPSSASKAKSTQAAPRQERILIAEDSAVNQKVALGQLRKLGYGAEAVGNGFEALQALNSKPYDIVLMDCHMPEMDGYEAASAIRQREKGGGRVWIIAMTAKAFHGDRAQCLAAGMDDCVSKPLRLTDLAEALERARPVAAILSEESPIDLNELAELGAITDEDGESALEELVGMFRREAPGSMASLRSAVEQAEVRAVIMAAHFLKGSSGHFGARRLHSLCGEIESGARTGNLAAAASLLVAIERELRRVLDALESQVSLQPA